MQTGTGSRVRYVVDTKGSQFTVQAFASGLISAVAHSPKIAIRDWSGEVEFEPGTLRDAVLKVKVAAASLQVPDKFEDNDGREIALRSNKVVT